MSKDTPIIHFKGNLSFRTISTMIADLKDKKDEFNIEMVVYKKIISLMIETLENINHYSDHFSEFIKIHPSSEPVFTLARNKCVYKIQSVNPIRKTDIGPVKNKIDKINTLDVDEMRLYYRETITNGQFTEKGGAGLGLIEMAKISCHPIEYKFTTLSDNYYNFNLELHID